MHRNKRWLTLVCVALAAIAGPAWADPDSARLIEAKELFRRGVALLEASDTERALEYFLRSREILPSSKNTVDAAICLERLGRSDEALDMYEEVVARFARDLDEEDRKSLAPVMASLRQRIGYLELSSNVEGKVVINGRARGTLPLRTALRVLPGKRDLRVVKEGYRSFEQSIEIRAAQTLSVDAELEPLAGTGALRIESSTGAVADALIDGQRVGETPWEGTLERGRHVVRTERGDVGSEPEVVSVLEGKTLLLRVSVRKLGASLTVSATPSTAQLFLGTVPLGRGAWSGRLPLGRYALRSSEEGYFEDDRTLEARSDAPETVRVALVRNPEHPRWPKAPRWHVGLGADLSPFFAPILDSDAERSCPGNCAGNRSLWGATGAVSASVSHDSGFGGELMLGYALLERNFSRAIFDRYNEATATYALKQTLAEHGPFAALRARMHRRTPFGFDFLSSLGMGLLFAQDTTSFSGSVWTNGAPVAALSSGAARVSEVSPFVTTSLGAARSFHQLSFHALLGVWFFPIPGPRFTGPELGVSPNCAPGSALGAVGCAPNTNAVVGERVHGAFWAIVPEFGTEYRF